jgi:hypothetical protein
MAKKLAMVFGVVFVLIGLLGFFNNPVVGLFAVNAVHNIVHILLGIILIWGSKGDAAKVLKIIAIGYFLAFGEDNIFSRSAQSRTADKSD